MDRTKAGDTSLLVFSVLGIASATGTGLNVKEVCEDMVTAAFAGTDTGTNEIDMKIFGL